MAPGPTVMCSGLEMPPDVEEDGPEKFRKPREVFSQASQPVGSWLDPIIDNWAGAELLIT